MSNLSGLSYVKFFVDLIMISAGSSYDSFKSHLNEKKKIEFIDGTIDSVFIFAYPSAKYYTKLIQDYSNLLKEPYSKAFIKSLCSKLDFANTTNICLRYLGETNPDLPLNIYQYKSFHLANKNSKVAIQGPPGTGKSKLITSILASRYVEIVLNLSSEKAKIDENVDLMTLVSSTNNEAVRNIYDKFNGEDGFLLLGNDENRKITSYKIYDFLESIRETGNYIFDQENSRTRLAEQVIEMNQLDVKTTTIIESIERMQSELTGLQTDFKNTSVKIRGLKRLLVKIFRKDKELIDTFKAGLLNNLLNDLSTQLKKREVFKDDLALLETPELGFWSVFPCMALPALKRDKAVLLNMCKKFAAEYGEEPKRLQEFRGEYQRVDLINHYRSYLTEFLNEATKETEELYRLCVELMGKLNEYQILCDIKNELLHKISALSLGITNAENEYSLIQVRHCGLAYSCFDKAQKLHLPLLKKKYIDDEAFKLKIDEIFEVVQSLINSYSGLNSKPPAWYRLFKKGNLSVLATIYPVIFSTSLSIGGAIPLGVELGMGIMDEAGQTLFSYALPLIHRTKSFISIGDLNQLPPITNNVEERIEDLLNQYNLDRECYKKYDFNYSLQKVFEDECLFKETLRFHFRCKPEIMKFFNDTFYKGQLINQLPMYEDLGIPALGFYNIAGETEIENGSLYNNAEIDQVLRAIEYLIGNGIEVGDIGVVAPYRAHISKLRKKIPHEVRVGTVHTFQGGEKKVIIMTSVVTTGNVNFLDQSYLINVAISRAQQSFIFIGNMKTLENKGNNISKLVLYMQSHGEDLSKIYLN